MAIKRFVTGNSAKLVELKNKIVAHFRESEWLELGTLTDHFELVSSHPRLLRSLRFGDDDYEGTVLFVLQVMAREPGTLGVIENYVATKCPEAGDDVSSHDVPGRRIVFSPDVFSVPTEGRDGSLVSVMMPFEASFDPVYQAIKDAVADVDLRCQRVTDIWDHTTIIQDVFSLIFRSYIVICDLSRRNANVLYETGIAHTLGRHVVPITQSADDVPFDLHHHRYLSYLNNAEGRETLRVELAKRLNTLASQRNPDRWQ